MKKRVIFSGVNEVNILSDDVTNEMIEDYQQSMNFMNRSCFAVREVEVLDSKAILEFNASPISKEASIQFIHEYECIPVVEVEIPELNKLEWSKDIEIKNPKTHLTFYKKDEFNNNNQLSTNIVYLPDFNKQIIDCAGVVNFFHVYENHYIRIISDAYRRDFGTRFDHQVTILDAYESLDYMDQRFGYVYNCMNYYKPSVKHLRGHLDDSLYKKVVDEKIPLIEDSLNKDENFDFKTLNESDKFWN